MEKLKKINKINKNKTQIEKQVKKKFVEKWENCGKWENRKRNSSIKTRTN